MPSTVFNDLCQKTRKKIGEDSFRLEQHLLEKSHQRSGATPLISGEIKVGVSIQMLAGGSHLDLVPLFEVSTSGLHNLFSECLEWALLTLEFPLVRWIHNGNWEVLNHLANQFA